MIAVLRVVAVIVIPVKTAERKIGVYFVFGFYLVGIMANGSNDLVNVHLADLRRIVGNGKFFCLRIPRSLLDTFGIERRLDAFLAHRTVAVNFDRRLDGLGL